MAEPLRLWRVDRADAIAALKSSTSGAPAIWECPCGCNAALHYARDARALYVVSEVTATRGEVVVIAIETEDELNDYLNRLPSRHADPVIAALRKSFRSKMS